MSLKTLEFLPEAIAEARAAYEWYVERSPAAGNAFIEELDRAMDLIARSPNDGPLKCMIRDAISFTVSRTISSIE